LRPESVARDVVSRRRLLRTIPLALLAVCSARQSQGDDGSTRTPTVTATPSPTEPPTDTGTGTPVSTLAPDTPLLTVTDDEEGETTLLTVGGVADTG
jgi:hypothetical protein